MKKYLPLISILLILGACTNKKNSTRPVGDTVETKTAKVGPAAMKTVKDAADTSDDESVEPSFEEVLGDLRASYNKIEKIDKQVIDGTDTLQLHETYYCLHDSSLRIPKRFLWGGNTTKDFLTNNFVSKIVILRNRDTVFKKIVKKDYFNGILDDQLTKYAILFGAGCMGYNPAKGGFMFGYSISPLTDLGTAVHLIVDKNGNEHIIDDFTFINKYHEEW